MNYNETLDFLYSQLPAYHRIGKAAYRSDLGNITALDQYLGHPHHNYSSIHIAGTNGKGSLSHMTASILMEAGYNTGLYTSPHLKDFRERIRLNGKMIPKVNVIRFIKDHYDLIRKLKPSFFEMTVAMAFDFFAAKKTDVAVIETGLGGRLDSTNIITPVLSVITNIGHDHMDLLGNTLRKIASEKAGIIKENVPVVIGESSPDLNDIFIIRAGECKSEIRFADQNFSCTLDDFNPAEGERGYQIKDLNTGKLFEGVIPMGGDCQIRNLQTLFQAFQFLKDPFKITDKQIIKGIRNTVRNTGLQGRWQIIGRDPLVICDTGHNREGIEYAVSQLLKIPSRKLHFVIGFVNDKDLGSVLPLFPADARYYFAKASVQRALDSEILMNEAMKYNLKGRAFPDVKSAFENALSCSSREDVIFIGGSTFIVAEVV